MQIVGADGAAAGVQGGRPRTGPEELRGAYGGVDKSNRLARGLKRRRVDISAHDGQAMCKWMVQKAAEIGDTADLRRAACRRYQFAWATLQIIYDKGVAHWNEKVKTLCVGGGTRGSLNKQGQDVKALL